jgi:hypothetical protein
MGVTYVHLDRLRCFEITARRRTNLCNTINKLFEAAQSAADGQLGLYEINKGSLIAVLTYTLLAIQSHKTIVKALWPHKPQTFLQQ